MPCPEIAFRHAQLGDLPAIVRLLADDPLGAQRESDELPLPASYEAAFTAIDRDPNQELTVACRGETIVGVLQLTFLPYITYRGGWRALIEGVRISRAERSQGVGRSMVDWAIGRARARDCHMVQLTTDKARPSAQRFYEALGFVASHEGLKMHLSATQAQGHEAKP